MTAEYISVALFHLILFYFDRVLCPVKTRWSERWMLLATPTRQRLSLSACGFLLVFYNLYPSNHSRKCSIDELGAWDEQTHEQMDYSIAYRSMTAAVKK